MTIAYPDVSNYEGGMPLEADTVAVAAKATEGTTFVDAQYGHFRAEAARVGAVFFGYHYLHPGGGAAQADHCFSVTGPGVNVMIDHEPTGAVMPSLQDALDFAARYRALGGLCTLDYLPHWAWQQLGSPDLAPLASAGLSLVSSSYTAYSDTGPGWTPYGGVTPAVWQWTDSFSYSGQLVDFNAYRGTAAQLRALLGYTAPDPAPVVPLEVRMIQLMVPKSATDASPGSIWLLTGSVYVQVSDSADNTAFTAAGVATANVDWAQHEALLSATTAPQPVELEGVVSGVAPIQVDASALTAAVVAALSDPKLLAAQGAAYAHALAVQEHNDTPPS